MKSTYLIASIVSALGVAAFSPLPIAKEGDKCGKNVPAQCNLGLYCSITNSKAGTGVCRKGKKLNEKCGGGIPNAIPCGFGLTCQYKPGSKPGEQGTCQVPFAKKNQSCEGGMLGALKCEKGLFCQFQHKNLPGAPGICVELGQTGSKCGGNTFPINPPCAEGLVCLTTSPGSVGKCGKKPVPPPLRKENQTCLRYTNPPEPGCEKGLVCDLKNPQIPDLGGICRKPGDVKPKTTYTTTTTKGPLPTPPPLRREGETCLRFTNPPEAGCADGLFCQLKDTQIPDLGGICVAIPAVLT